MDGARRIRPEGGVRDEEHARGAERDEALPLVQRADAAGGGGIVARAAGHGDIARHAPFLRQTGAQRARAVRAFDEARHVAAIEAGDGQKFVGPVALADIKPQRAGGVRHIFHMLAGQQQPHIGLGQQHLGDAREHLGLVLAHPHQFGRGETGHGRVAGALAQAQCRRLQRLALRRAAAVVPQHAGAQRFATGPQQGGAVHLARQADALRRRVGLRMVSAQLRQRGLRGGPPVMRVLLAVARLRARHREGGARRPQHGVVGGQEQHLDFGGADIDTDEHRWGYAVGVEGVSGAPLARGIAPAAGACMGRRSWYSTSAAAPTAEASSP